jgi:hypothetical protein
MLHHSEARHPDLFTPREKPPVPRGEGKEGVRPATETNFLINSSNIFNVRNAKLEAMLRHVMEGPELLIKKNLRKIFHFREDNLFSSIQKTTREGGKHDHSETGSGRSGEGTRPSFL